MAIQGNTAYMDSIAGQCQQTVLLMTRPFANSVCGQQKASPEQKAGRGSSGYAKFTFAER